MYGYHVLVNIYQMWWAINLVDDVLLLVAILEQKTYHFSTNPCFFPSSQHCMESIDLFLIFIVE